MQGVQIGETPLVVFAEGVVEVVVHGIHEDFHILRPGIKSFADGRNDAVCGVCVWLCGKGGGEYVSKGDGVVLKVTVQNRL